MDNTLKKVFVYTCTILVVFTMYCILNFILSGVLWLVIQFLDRSLALTVFRYSFFILLFIESIPTFYGIRMLFTKDDKE